MEKSLSCIPRSQLCRVFYEQVKSSDSLRECRYCSHLNILRFLPSDKKERQEVVKELEQETRTIILYEAPHRLVKTLKELEGVLGNRRITVCRELTKKHETAFVTTLREAIVYYEETDPKGECVLVVEGKSREEIRKEAQSQWEQMSLEDHVQYYMDQGIDKKEAMKKVAKDRGISKRDVYNSLI